VLDEAKALLLAEFLDENWTLFTTFLEEHGEDTDEGEVIINLLNGGD
jgi:hypothetical protein